MLVTEAGRTNRMTRAQRVEVDARRTRGNNTVPGRFPMSDPSVHLSLRWLRTLRSCALAALALGHSTRAFAQAPPVTLFDLSASPSVVERADRAYWAGDAAESLRLMAAWLQHAPGDVDARWRAARASVALGIIANGAAPEARWFRNGIAHSDEALRLDPTHVEVQRWAVASKGKLAVGTGARETATLVQEIWDLSHQLLERDPDDAFAHHALGTLHYEVMKMSPFKRFLARMFLGNEALSRASWEDAVYHHERAVSLDPTAIVFRVGFAEALKRRGRVPEALEQLRSATSLPSVHPGDPDYTGRAHRYLKELLAEGNG